MEMRVEHAAVAKVVVARCDMVGNAVGRKCTFEDGRPAHTGVALVMHGDACPAKRLAGLVRSAGGIGTHALCRDVRGDNLTPVRFDGGREKGFRVGEDALASRVGVVVDDACRWMYEVVVGAEMEVKGFAEGGECQSEGVRVV